MNDAYMQRAVSLSERGMELGHGGPFGAVIVRDDSIVAIRHVCRELETNDLSGCEIYSSCEPCPMCLGAIYWSRIAKVYFAITLHDAAGIKYRDELYTRSWRSRSARESCP